MAFLDTETEGLGPGLAGGLIAYISATVFLGLYYAVKPSVLKHCLSIDRQAAKWFVLTGFLVCASHMFRFMKCTYCMSTIFDDFQIVISCNI